MTIRIKPRGGTSTELLSYVPQAREIVVDTTRNAVRVGDGTTAGGNLLTVATSFNSSTNLTDPTAGSVGTILILTQEFTDTLGDAGTVGQVYPAGLYEIVQAGNPIMNEWLQVSSFDGIPSHTTLPTSAPTVGHIIYLNTTDGTQGSI